VFWCKRLVQRAEATGDWAQRQSGRRQDSRTESGIARSVTAAVEDGRNAS
jgi:hypothetical protein